MKKLLLLQCFLIIITIIGCSSTKTQSGSLSGTVNLQDMEDHSGIVIGVYDLAELNQEILDANKQWPNIGVVIDQHTEFDHRFGTLVTIGETDASGFFEIDDISTGIYNIVIIKNGFGFRYLYEVHINEGENILPVTKDILTLYKETVLDQDSSIPAIWESDHHYIVQQDVFLDFEITIEPGAVIRMDSGKEIVNYTNFNAVGEHDSFIWFTKNDGFSENLVSVEPDSNLYWSKLEIETNSQCAIEWCKIDWANIGLFSHVNGFDISNCIFRDCNCGFRAEDVDSTFCSNLLCDKVKNEEQGGILFDNVENGSIKRNIAIHSYNGIKVKKVIDVTLHNNYLLYNSNGMFISWDSDPEIKYNDFYNNEWAIHLIVRSKPEILRNNINGENGILLGHGPQTDDQNQPDIHYNNINAVDWAIKYLQNNELNIDATNNYFFTTNSEEISEKIYDYYDDPGGLPPYNYGIAFYEPFLMSEVLDCGIE